MYVSLTLELPMTKISESVCAVVVKTFEFYPIPRCTNRCILMLAGNGYKPTILPFTLAITTNEISVSQAIGSQNRSLPLFISSALKIPSTAQQKEYLAVTYFLIPRSILSTNVALHLFIQTEEDLEFHTLPGTIVGATEYIEHELKQLTGTPGHLPILFPLTYSKESIYYDKLYPSKCVLEITCLPYGENLRNGMEENKDLISYTGVTGDREKWQVFSRELGQKQEVLNMIMKEIDERKQLLKVSGEEIGELRRNIHLLTDESMSLNKRLQDEENLQLNPTITKEIYQMHREELRVKLLKLAQAYKTERQKNEEFEKALKKVHMEITLSDKMKEELEQVQSIHEQRAKKLLEMQQETHKIDMYKEIVKKQEKVIDKMEGLLDKAIKNIKRSQQDILEADKLKSEVSLLQKHISSSAIQKTEEEVATERYQREIPQMEEQVARLQKELKDRNVAIEDDDLGGNKDELEVRLQRAEVRDKAIDNEMAQSAKVCKARIEKLRLELAEKQAIMKKLNITPDEF